MHYTRKLSSFAVGASEDWIYAGNIQGRLLCIGARDFDVAYEAPGHAGGIEAIVVHPTLPYLATLAIDSTVWLWDLADPARPRKIQELRLTDISVDGYEGRRPRSPLSCPLAFHPRERRLLTHSAHGAVVELAFDGASWTQLWAEGYFSEADEETVYDVDYVRYLVGSEHVFASTFGGHVAVVDPKAPKEPLLRWRYDQRTIHCAEHVEGTDYLLASDTRRVIRFDVSGKKPPLVGEPVLRDHLEQIKRNPTSGRVFATSFDRTVIEVDPDTCASRGVVLHAPFKLRWLHTFARDPDTLLVYCRNGALYKASMAEKRVTGMIKETPNALWTGVTTARGDVAIAGEGPEMLRLRVAAVDPRTYATTLDSKWSTTPGTRGSYAKRMALHVPTGALVQGRSDGEILVTRGATSRVLTTLPSPVRDLATAPEGFDLFVVTEDGVASRIDLETGATLATFRTPEEPLWSLAYNHRRRLLAVCERQGALRILGGHELDEKLTVDGAWAPKRMTWSGESTLLVGRGSAVQQLDVASGTMTEVVPRRENTIEDFAFDETRRYLVACTYGRRIYLFEYGSWAELDATDFDLDFPKGILWLARDRAPDAHPYEFIAFGRSGVVLHYRVHDNTLNKLGVVTPRLSTPIHDDAGVTVP